MPLKSSFVSLILSALIFVGVAHAEKELSDKEVLSIAEEAYVYGYSLITSEVTRIQMTNVAKPDAEHAPMNSFLNIPRYPPGNYRGVSAPNADTLYSLAWLDLGKEPIVFSHPDMGKRYFLFPMYSLWMPVVKSPGSRTTGEKAGQFLISGPSWKGRVPKGMTHIKSPTRYMVILGRTYADGTEADYKIVNALQAEYSLIPLSSFGKPYTYVAPPVDPNPGFDLKQKPQQVILDMTVDAYFNRMAKLLGEAAPPAPEDRAMVAKMARIGLVPGKEFSSEKFSPAVKAGLKDMPKTVLDKILALQKTGGKVENGWLIPGAAGAYGTNYLARALIAAVGWPANLPEDAVYPTALIDGKGEKLNGANKYTITFPKGKTPPVNGFWSITMYFDDGGWWFYPNKLNKFTVSPRDNLKTNADGSTTIYVQHESPGDDKVSNWLPSPAGSFLLTMRMYWPKTGKPSILPPGKGNWAPPPVEKVP